MARDTHSERGKVWISLLPKNRIAWKVVDFTSANGIPHVHIMKVDDPTECKLISVRTLRDGYDLLPE